MFDCKNCMERCRASCCGYVPIPIETYKKYPPLVYSDIQEFEGNDELTGRTGGFVIVTQNNHCAYLIDNLCTIYEHRPEVCRKFGDESHPNLFCPYQDKDGRPRSRQERRSHERTTADALAKLIKRNS